MGTVQVLTPSGDLAAIPAEQLESALSQGYQPDPTGSLFEKRRAQAQQAGDVPAMAGAYGAKSLETIPFVGGAIEKHVAEFANEISGGGTAEPLKALEAAKAEHPLAGAAGTVGGIAGQTAIAAATGGAEGLLEGAGVLGEGGAAALSPLARVATRAAIGAGEGAGYGAGSAVNDAVLSNHPLTAEMLLAHAAGGALFGGGLAGGLSVGGELAGEAMAKVGNSARAAAVSDVVGQDLNALSEAGLGQKEINQLFKTGIVRAGDTPAQVQLRLAAKMASTEKELAELGGKLASSGQSIDLRAILAKAPREAGDYAGLLGDDAATIGRVGEIRKALLPQEAPAARALLLAVDDSLVKRAANISEDLATQTKAALAEQRDLLQPLSKMVDGAMAKTHVPEAAASDTFGSLMRNGVHFSMWNTISKMAGGHMAAPFLGLSAANFLRKVVSKPGDISQTFMRGLAGVSKATGQSSEALEAAVTAAVAGTRHSAAPAASAVTDAILPRNATDADVSRVREMLAKAERSRIPKGHPAIDAALTRQRTLLAQALPPPRGNPNTPMALARPSLGPTGKEITAYNSTLRVLADPIGTIGRIGKGKATAAEIRILSQSSPELAKRAGQAMLDKAAANGKPVPAATKRAIEILHGTAFDPATTPAKVARIQVAAFAPAKAPARAGQTQGGGAASVNAKGLAAIDVGDRISAGMMQAGDKARGK